MDVGTIVARSMRRYRDRIALVGPDGTKTYGEVGARIFQLARALRALGLKSEIESLICNRIKILTLRQI